MKKRTMTPMKQVPARVKGWVTTSSQGDSVRPLVRNNATPIVSSAIPRKQMVAQGQTQHADEDQHLACGCAGQRTRLRLRILQPALSL
jgi:hypothetical protein